MGNDTNPQSRSGRSRETAGDDVETDREDGGSGEEDVIDATVAELFENRGRDRPTTEIEDALIDETLSVEARIKLQEALRDVDLEDAGAIATIRADLEAVLTAQESIEADIRELLARVRALETALEDSQPEQ